MVLKLMSAINNTGSLVAACIALAALSLCTPAVGQSKKSVTAIDKGPKVVVHPLTQEEQLQEQDYLAYEPLMGEGVGVFSLADPSKVDSRAEELIQKGFKTESPFVDWAHYLVLSLAQMEPGNELDMAKARSWEITWGQIGSKSKALFEEHEAIRAQSIADNALCDYRLGEQEKNSCQIASAVRAKIGSPALGKNMAQWVASAATELAQSAGWPSKWEEKKERLLMEPSGEKKVQLLEHKLINLDAWALVLNPQQERIAYDALEQLRLWSKDACWSQEGKFSWEPFRGGSKSLGLSKLPFGSLGEGF